MSDRLRGRKRPTVVYQLRVEDDTAARAAVSAAETDYELAKLRTDSTPAMVEDAKVVLDDAHSALAACYEPVTIRAMAPVEFEALVAEHPGTEADNEAWDPKTFPQAVFLSCVESEGDDALSREEWEKFLEEDCSQGERAALRQTALNVNARWPDGTVPKG